MAVSNWFFPPSEHAFPHFRISHELFLPPVAVKPFSKKQVWVLRPEFSQLKRRTFTFFQSSPHFSVLPPSRNSRYAIAPQSLPIAPSLLRENLPSAWFFSHRRALSLCLVANEPFSSTRSRLSTIFGLSAGGESASLRLSRFRR